MRDPKDTKYVWDKENFKIIQNSMSKEKSYFVEITIYSFDFVKHRNKKLEEQIKKLDLQRKEVRLERKKYKQ